MGGRLVPVTIESPAIFGINKQQSGSTLPLQWAIEASNLVISDTGKPASRKGFRKLTAQVNSALTFFEYTDSNGDEHLLFTDSNGAYLLDSANQVTDVSGACDGGYWQFVGVQGGVYGVKAGQPPVFLSGPSGTFQTVTPTTSDPTMKPTPAISAHSPLAAFGRVWCIDGDRLLYTKTLQYQEWDGVYDLSLVWRHGADKATALAEFNGHLVIFGEDSIIVYRGDYDPTKLVLVESVGGIGCPFPRTIVQVGNDLLFLSRSGVRSLGRTLQEGKMPIGDVTMQVHEYLAQAASVSNTHSVQAAYDSRRGYYLLSVPAFDKILVLHMRLGTSMNTPPITEWDIRATAIGTLRGRVFAGMYEGLAEYKSAADHDGIDPLPIGIKLVLPWWGIEQDDFRSLSQRIKSLKRAFVTLGGYTPEPVKLCWTLDYGASGACQEREIPMQTVDGYHSPQPYPFADPSVPVTDPLDGLAWWGESEFAGGAGQTTLQYQLSRSGMVLQLSLEATAVGEEITIHNLAFQVKTGRMQA